LFLTYKKNFIALIYKNNLNKNFVILIFSSHDDDDGERYAFNLENTIQAI